MIVRFEVPAHFFSLDMIGTICFVLCFLLSLFLNVGFIVTVVTGFIILTILVTSLHPMVMGPGVRG